MQFNVTPAVAPDPTTPPEFLVLPHGSEPGVTTPSPRPRRCNKHTPEGADGTKEERLPLDGLSSSCPR